MFCLIKLLVFDFFVADAVVVAKTPSCPSYNGNQLIVNTYVNQQKELYHANFLMLTKKRKSLRCI